MLSANFTSLTFLLNYSRSIAPLLMPTASLSELRFSLSVLVRSAKKCSGKQKKLSAQVKFRGARAHTLEFICTTHTMSVYVPIVMCICVFNNNSESEK